MANSGQTKMDASSKTGCRSLRDKQKWLLTQKIDVDHKVSYKQLETTSHPNQKMDVDHKVNYKQIWS
jgi:hypothetical protein